MYILNKQIIKHGIVSCNSQAINYTSLCSRVWIVISANVWGCKANINLGSNYKAAAELSTAALLSCWARMQTHYSQRRSCFNLRIVWMERELNYQSGGLWVSGGYVCMCAFVCVCVRGAVIKSKINKLFKMSHLVIWVQMPKICV